MPPFLLSPLSACREITAQHLLSPILSCFLQQLLRRKPGSLVQSVIMELVSFVRLSSAQPSSESRVLWLYFSRHYNPVSRLFHALGAFVDPSTFAPAPSPYSADLFRGTAFMGYSRGGDWDRMRGSSSFGGGAGLGIGGNGIGMSSFSNSMRDDEEYFNEDEEELDAERRSRDPLVAPRGSSGRLMPSYAPQQANSSVFEFE